MESIKSHTLHTFGFNAYGQLSQQSLTKIQDRHTNVTRVLMATWESTIVLTDQGSIELWGFTTSRLLALVTYWNNICKTTNKKIRHIFGDLQLGLGTIDNTGIAIWWDLQLSQNGNGILLGENIKEAGLCQGMNRLYLLSVDGKVKEYDCSKWDQSNELKMPRVTSMAVSTTHVLFGVKGSAPVYGLGSNRMGQLGMDTSTTQQLDQPTILDFFDGLGIMGSEQDESGAVKVACGPFHSAVILHNDLYTFGWNDQGRIGWGTLAGQDDEDAEDSQIGTSVIRLASFAGVGDDDDDDQEMEVSVDKVCCGSAHTVVIGMDGSVWSCGSDKYSQLGRSLGNKEYDDFFRQCPTIQDSVIECQSGPWSTFLQTI